MNYPQLFSPVMLAFSLVLYGFCQFAHRLIVEMISPVRKLQGPKSRSFIYGSFKDLWNDHGPISSKGIQEQWFEEYGHTFVSHDFFNAHRRLQTIDIKAIQHILKNDDIYHKPKSMRYILHLALGDSVLITEGDKHRRLNRLFQRKVMNPAFGQSQIRQLTETFIAKSIQLHDIWAAQLSRQGGTTEIDAVSWLSKATLDIIGSTGFDYDFKALNNDGSDNELDEAFSALFRSPPGIFTPWRILQANVPFLRIFPKLMSSSVSSAITTTRRLGHELVNRSKAYYIGTGQKGDNWGGGGRDLLSLLVKSNLTTELSKERMDDEDVVAQIPTFLIAGHETTSITTTWALYALAQNTSIQAQLRAELLSVTTENPTMETLNALPYLNAFVREVLRLYPPVVSASRVATRDDVIPLSNPVKTVDGDVLHEIPDKSLWGEDADEFRPARWQQVPTAVSAIPGVWGNTLTFLGGPRACIGWRFALVEMKALIFTLLRSFEFGLGVPNEDVWVKRSMNVQRPTVKDGPIVLPMVIRMAMKSSYIVRVTPSLSLNE